MSKPKIVIDHIFILDKSSSMQDCRDATIGGYNEQIAGIIKDQSDFPEQEHLFSLVIFSDNVEYKIWRKPVNEIYELDHKNYVPNGMTALNDALGMSLSRMREESQEGLNKNAESQVLVVVLTDGQENASKEFGGQEGAKKVKDLVTELDKEEQWTFVFVGAGKDAIGQASQYGFAASNSMAYSADVKGTEAVFKSLAGANTRYATKTQNRVSDLYQEAYTGANAALGSNTKANFFDDEDRLAAVNGVNDLQEAIIDPSQHLAKITPPTPLSKNPALGWTKKPRKLVDWKKKNRS